MMLRIILDSQGKMKAVDAVIFILTVTAVSLVFTALYEAVRWGVLRP